MANPMGVADDKQHRMTAGGKLYDAFMRLPLIVFELYFFVREWEGIRRLVAVHPYFGRDWLFLATFTARISILIFIAVIVALQLSRYRPTRKYDSWSPKVTALVGTLLGYFVLATPRAQPHLVWDSVSTALTLAGSTMAILVAMDLGRSFSIMPEARKLVVTGAYSVVRHPLYLVEEIATVGFFLQFRSWQAAVVLLVHFYFQIRRMDWEEGILSAQFPAYAEYKRGTYRLVPGLY
jgi:protein-S-isoprenylcysteine O-methyltransferase Ste14